MALVHCRECGEMIAESAPTCPKCGARQGLKDSAISITETDLSPSAVLNVVSFIWPLVGLILYIVYNDKSPKRAKECGKWALIGCIVEVVIVVFVLIIYAGLLAGLIAVISDY